MTTKKPAKNDVVITGIGLVTALGVGAQANWEALSNGAAPIFDSERFAPYTVHPLPEIDWTEQIVKRDQRQMETWQRIGTYTAGLALEDAGMKEVPEYTSTMDMIVAAGGGERDVDVDALILAEAADQSVDKGILVNEKLTTELRPTLFLAQLANLLAGNISIVHKVTGSSRTFMGEEGAGISALKTAVARISSGQSTHALVGGAYNCEHPDMLLGHEMSAHLLRGHWSPVWQRDNSDGGGLVLGSGGAFLVLESRKHAEARGARIYAVLDGVFADQGAGDAESTSNRLNALSTEAGLQQVDVLVSGASGAKNATSIEKNFLTSTLKNVPVRGFSSAIGHLHESQFPAGVAIAALSLFHGQNADQIDSRFESPSSKTPETIGVLTIGYEEGEGVAHLSKERSEAQ
ncbi:MAG: beta-ketoacyl-ACP synthase [Pseudomonadota bacterium]